MAKKIENCIYILTNPQYPGVVKIGYASDLKQHLSLLNKGTLIGFVPYAVYETSVKNAEMEIHAIIKLLNPILSASKFDNGYVQGREFFKLEPEEAFELLQHIARVSGTEKCAYRVTSDCKKMDEEYDPDDLSLDDEPEGENSFSREEKRPATIHFLQGKGGRDYRPFTTWTDYTEQVVLKAIEVYGLDTVKRKLFNPDIKFFHTRKRDTFADNKAAMRGFSCREIADDLWFLTNYSADSHQRIIKGLVQLFPMVENELIYK